MSMTPYDAEIEEGWDRLYNELGPQYLQEHAYELYEEHAKQAIQEFQADRLKSYFLNHPDVAQPAFETLDYARRLLPDHPRPALVFATTSMEIATKAAFLKPFIYGLIHLEALAEPVMSLAVQRDSGKFRAVLSAILKEFGGVDFPAYRRSGSEERFPVEIEKLSAKRNTVVHEGALVELAEAEKAIAIADALLSDIFPTVLKHVQLHLHGGEVCGSDHKTMYLARLEIGEGLSVMDYPFNAQIAHYEPLPLEAITGNFADYIPQHVLVTMRNSPPIMRLDDVPVQGKQLKYRIQLHPDTLEFTGTMLQE
jgi:hypothetical protein